LKERQTKEREKSIEEIKRAKELYDEEIKMEEEKRKLLEEKERRKREAAERA
jgi:hypothetical protein